MQSPRYPSPTPPRTNQNWPEGYGFRIGGNAPVIITDIFENSYAQKSGLRPGDQLIEVDGVNVQGLSKDDVIVLARQSKSVPPALCVISRIRTFTLRRRRGTFGFKVRGGGPVFVSQLEERGPAKVAGIRLGDMLVEVNNTSVRDMTYIEVERLVHTSGSVLQLVLIAGVKSIEEIEKRNTASRFRRAREFFQEMNYYLAGEEKKKSQLVKLLNKFAKDKSVETLARGIMKILETPVQKRLIPTIRQLIPKDKRKIFSDILQENQNKASLVRSASFEGKLSDPPQSKSPETTASKYRTWSKGSKSPSKQTPPTSPRGNTISYHQRPSSMVLQNDLEQSSFQRSHSTSAAFSPRRSPEIPVGEDDRSVQNLAETLRFQMNQFLTRGEQLVLKQRLKEYHKHRNARMLVSSLEPILDDQEKLKMVPYLSQLLPENEQYAFDKEAQKLMSKYLQGSCSEGPDVIDVAYRVQGTRLAETPQPKNLIGGSMQGELDLYPVKETPNSPRSNESSTVAALLTAAENTNFSDKPGNTITVEALVHSEKREAVSETDYGTKSPISTLQTSVGNATQNIASDGSEAPPPKLPNIHTAADELDTRKEKGEIKSRSTHSDLSSAIEDQRKHLAKQASNEVPHPPIPPSGGFVPPAPPPPPPPPPSPGVNISGNDTLPKMQLRRVNWEKLGIAGLENTVWGQLGRNDPLDQLEDFVELEQRFSSTKSKKATVATKKQEIIEILEPRKQYNIAILLGHLKLPHEEIKRAVLSMDETTLSEAHVKQLLLYAPDHKEIQKYKHFADDEEKLGQCDKFSMMVSKIPGYRHRLKAMLFKSHFADKLEEIKPELERVVKASQELRESKKLQQVLQLVLAFGNYMNQGNARIAGASAFRVGFLAKLSSTKTSDNKSNLLKFLVKTVETKCPEVLDLKNELTSISLAARVSYQMVKEEIDEVVKTMKDVKTDLEQHGSQIPENDEDKFAEIMGSFVENSKRDMETLLTLHDQMQSEYTKTAKFFGEDPNMTTTEEFFGIFSTFLDQFEAARLELVTQRKRKEEQAKREIEKQNRLKKKKELKSSSTSGEEQDESHETTSELSKQQENIFTRRQKYARHSSSSESEVPTSPGLALSYEMRKNELFKSQERLDQKRSPPPVLPKPKPKPKPKLPPTNRNGALPPSANQNGLSSSSANRSPTSPSSQPINSQAMQEIANEISQIKLHNNKKNKVDKSNSSDSESADGNVFTKQEVKPPPIPRKPAKSVDFSELQLTQNTKSGKALQNSKSAEENSNSIKESKMNSLPRQNAIYFEETDGYSKMDSSPDPRREETSSTPREILNNLKERGANLMMNKKRVLQNMCWPLGCQNGDNNGQDDEDPLYSTVNFATLGYNNGTNVDTYKDTAEVNAPECTTKAYVNPTYSPPCTSPKPITSSSPPKTHLSNVIQISPDLGIKEVQSLVKGATSYTVGDNGDLYSLPVKGRSSSDDTEPTPGKSTPEMNSPTKKNPIVVTPDDLYSQPILDSPRRNSDSDIAAECEGPYAQTVLFEQTPTRSKSEYDIPGLLIDTTPTPFDLKPPNFKPPPPPPGGSPILRKKNRNKHSPPVLRNMNKVKSPKKIALRDTESSPKGKNFAFQMKRSQSESDLTSEPIFATPSSIGIPREDNNNNRHSMFVTPKEVGKLREYFIYSDEGFENNVQSRKLRDQIGNGRKQIGNHRVNTFPEIVPPPPTSTPIIDTDSLGVYPPPPMYPPPRLHPSENVLVDDNTQSDESQWQEMIDSLPPPPPDMLES